MSQPLIKLNLGCGQSKIDGCVNIDVEESCKPDLVHDFTKKQLPYEDKSIEEVYLFHTIEHISKRYHASIFDEVFRVLRVGGLFYLSYPEFTKCVSNWLQNKYGKREFWEATIYGRQLYPSDFHVCILDPNELGLRLESSGFTKIVHKSEPREDYNTITACERGLHPYVKYEKVIADNTKVKLVA
jgi:hypothetical protein